MTRFGPLSAHLVGDPAATGPVVVLLHGFGAPGTDLVPLARVFQGPEDARYVFLEAPVELPTPFGMGRAWWMIDPMRFQEAVARGTYDAIEKEEPEGMTEARAALSAALDAVEAELSPPSPGVVLGGFSQGSMLALDLALEEPDRELAGLVLMSATLVARDRWVAGIPGRKGLPVLQSHGAHDPLLPFTQAQRLRGLLEDGGLDVTWIPFDGQHEIPPPVIHAGGDFMRRITKPRS
jgi:phospholipase/carboxylesterase